MEVPTEPGKPRDTRKILQAVLIAMVIVGAGLVGYVLYQRSALADESGGSPAIVSGDTVTMNYIGRLPDGRVFDTSILSVAQNDALYPKSLTFTKRDNASYVPFNMTAGNYGSGGTIKGFALGVIGLHEGDESVLDIKVGEGYAVDPSRVKWTPLVESLPIIDHLSPSEFVATFGVDPVPLHIYQHPFWKWDLQVIDVFGDFVTIMELPSVGQVVYPFGNPNDASSPMGWPVVVESYDTSANGGLGILTVRHQLTSADVYEVKGKDVDGQTIILTALNTQNQSFQVGKSNSQTGYSAELAGRELFFEVTIIRVKSA